MDLWHTNQFYQYLVYGLLSSAMGLFYLIQSGQRLVFCMDFKEFTSMWIVFLFISSYNFIDVNRYIQFLIFAYSNNSVLHTLLAPMLHGYDVILSNTWGFLSSLLLSAILCAILVLTAWFTLKLLLQYYFFFHYSPDSFCSFEFNYTFYYTVFCSLCFIINIAIIC